MCVCVCVYVCGVHVCMLTRCSYFDTNKFMCSCIVCGVSACVFRHEQVNVFMVCVSACVWGVHVHLSHGYLCSNNLACAWCMCATADG